VVGHAMANSEGVLCDGILIATTGTP